jgi:threonine dehydrogenase-like Zn-dependent dehydrogenase
MDGAGKVIAIDRCQGRLRMAAEEGNAVTINDSENDDVVQALKDTPLKMTPLRRRGSGQVRAAGG